MKEKCTVFCLIVKNAKSSKKNVFRLLIHVYATYDCLPASDVKFHLFIKIHVFYVLMLCNCFGLRCQIFPWCRKEVFQLWWSLFITMLCCLLILYVLCDPHLKYMFYCVVWSRKYLDMSFVCQWNKIIVFSYWNIFVLRCVNKIVLKK